jgi:hypothetical protein
MGSEMSLPPYAWRVCRLLDRAAPIHPPSPEPKARERAIAAIARAIATKACKRLYARLVCGTVAAAVVVAATISGAHLLWHAPAHDSSVCHGYFEAVDGKQSMKVEDCWTAGPDGKLHRLFER